MIERGYFGRALQIVGADPLTYVFGGLALHLIVGVSFGLLIGPAISGIVWITLKHCRGEQVVFGDLFKGFDHFSNSLVAGLAFGVLVLVGLALGFVPGIILGSLFCFVFPFVVDRDLPLPEAMAASRRIGADGGPGGDLLDRSLFFLFALLVGISGIVLGLVGMFFTWPLMWAVIAVAYEDLVGSRTAAAPGP